MLNEKFRERVEVWQVFTNKKEEFPAFFQQVLETCLTPPEMVTEFMKEQTSLLVFLNHCFNSMEVALCRDQAKRLVSLAMWSCLQPSIILYFNFEKFVINFFGFSFRTKRTRITHNT